MFPNLNSAPRNPLSYASLRPIIEDIISPFRILPIFNDGIILFLLGVEEEEE
jgi:hypothetical protein